MKGARKFHDKEKNIQLRQVSSILLASSILQVVERPEVALEGGGSYVELSLALVVKEILTSVENQNVCAVTPLVSAEQLRRVFFRLYQSIAHRALQGICRFSTACVLSFCVFNCPCHVHLSRDTAASG